MKNKNYSKAKTLTLIPLFVLALILICAALASVLAVPTSKGILYTIFAIGALVGGFISPFPCLVLSVIGTVCAAKAKKEGVTNASKYFILGIIEIVVCAIGAFLAIIMYIAGQGV